MPEADKKVAVLVHNYFEQVEFTGPVDALKRAGVQVTVVSCGLKKNLRGLHHIEKGEPFVADMMIDDVDFDDYDGLVLPGGALNADKLRMDERAQLWVQQFLQEGKLVAAICHAPWLLVSAGCVRGRTLTSFYTIQDDIRNAGGQWLDQQVVVNNNLITSRQPDDIPVFNQAILKFLAK